MNVFNKIKEKAKNLINISKYVGESKQQDQIHPSEQFLIETISTDDTIVPVAQLEKIAQETFDIEKYEVIIRSLTHTLEKELNSNKIIKLLIISDYLLKNGCSGCIDDLRDHLYIFKYFQKYEEQKATEMQAIIQKKALHLCKLLEDKQLLQKEKIISCQIKRQLEANKSQIYGLGNIEGLDATEQSKFSRFKSLKYFFQLNDLVENYFYKYLDNMNDKLDDMTETIGVKVDQYIGYIQKKIQSRSTDKSQNSQFVDSCMEYDIDSVNNAQKQSFEPVIGTDILEFEDNPDEDTFASQNKKEEQKQQQQQQQKQEIQEEKYQNKQIEFEKEELQMIDLLELEDNTESKLTASNQFCKNKHYLL
ncbi:hypothetical protein ABPG72_005824 [Tetrahymena utriculariae]